MKPRHKVSRTAIALIKSFEGFREQAARLPGGLWTIGYGHTKTARASGRVTPAEAEMLLLYDLVEIDAAVNALTYTPLTQNQFDALVCFAFNVGLDAFRRSTVLLRVNEGAMLQAACSFDMWRKADFEGERIVVDALVRRRAAEKVLFLTPTDGWVPSPSPVLRPLLDYETGAAVPRDRPADLTTSLVGEAAILVREDAAPEASAANDSQRASKTANAAEAVAERLRSILPDAPPPPAATVELAPFPSIGEPRPIATAFGPSPLETDPFEPTLTPIRPLNVEPVQHVFYGDLPDDDAEDLAFDEEPAETHRLSILSTVLIGLAGMAVFASVVLWGFKIRRPFGFIDPLLIVAVIGILGIACVAGVVYSLLSRFDQRKR